LAGPKVRAALVRVPDPGHRVHGGDRILFAETLDKPSETFPIAFTSSFPKVLLWIFEAAHVPISWATEVLDGFIKDGKPSRAEFTDAAAGSRLRR
jgi:hypothetical protein